MHKRTEQEVKEPQRIGEMKGRLGSWRAILIVLFLTLQPAYGRRCTTDAQCDDGVFCNGIESCDSTTGHCVSIGSCPQVVDGCIIRGATCDEVNDTCIDAPDDSLCDDGVFCNGAESCNPETGLCVAVSACPPFISGCLVGGCDEELDTCTTVPDDSLCDDGIFCNGTESCGPTGDCVAVSACPPYVDGCVIRGAECDEASQTCLDVADDSLCDNGLFCDGIEYCDEDSGLCFAVSSCPPFVNGCLVSGGCDESGDNCLVTQDDSLCPDGLVCAPSGDCAIQILIDLQPTSAGNQLKIPKKPNPNRKNPLSLVILGTNDLDVTEIDPVSVRLEGVAALRSSYRDLGSPLGSGSQFKESNGSLNGNDKDGLLDLMLTFSAEELIEALELTYGPLEDGESLMVQLTGELVSGGLLLGQDMLFIESGKGN